MRLLEERSLLRTAVDGVSALLAYWDSGLICRFRQSRVRAMVPSFPRGQLLGRHVSEFSPVLTLIRAQRARTCMRRFERAASNVRP